MKTREELQKYLSGLVDKLNEIQNSNIIDSEYFDDFNFKDDYFTIYYSNINKNLELSIYGSGITIDVDLTEDIPFSEIYKNLLIIIAENYIDK